MKEKEQQIEEMAKDFKCCYPCEMFNGYEASGALHNCNCEAYNKSENCAIARTVAKCLIVDNYRKLPEDSVVLKKENYDKLCHLAYFGYDDAYEKGSKETAEKILKLAEEYNKGYEDNFTFFIKAVKEKFGVEIKE